MSKVCIDDDHGVALLTIEAPPVNVIDVALREAALREAAGARAVVVTGAGRAFSTGVDLNELFDGARPMPTGCSRR